MDKYFKKAKEYNKKRYGYSEDPKLQYLNPGYFLWEDTVVALMFQLEYLSGMGSLVNTEEDRIKSILTTWFKGKDTTKDIDERIDLATKMIKGIKL